MVLWQDVMIPLVRGLILDLDETAYKYSDTILTRVIMVATLQVSQSQDFDYVINVGTSEISPDITEDYAAQNLIALKAACMLQMNEAMTASAGGVMVKDAIGAVDTRNYPTNIIEILRSGKSYCDMYGEAVLDGERNGAYAGAQAIVGPIRQYWAASGSHHRYGR